MRNHKVLVVHSQLAQHGSERLMYELVKLLIDQGVSVDVLVRPFGIRKQYYYPLLRKLGVSVVQRLVTLRHATFLFKSLRTSDGMFAALWRRLYAKFAEITFFRLARTYDRVVIIGMETYCDSFALMRGDKSSIYVHHVMHQFQQERNYCKEYDLSRLIVADERQRKEIQQSLPELELLNFPLPFDLRGATHQPLSYDFKLAFMECRPIRIGVVSRVNIDRPNEPIFRHFAALLAEVPAELHFFGLGDPKIYSELLLELHLTSSELKFHGHTQSIPSSLEYFGIDIAWSISMMESISYAAIELISIGMPVFFINIGDRCSGETNNPIKGVESVAETIKFHQKLFDNPNELDMLRAQQHNYVLKTFDSAHLQKKLRHLYHLE